MGVDWSQLTLRSTAVGAAVEVALLLVALVVVPRDRRPSSALAWILLFLLLPLVGALLFAVIGSPRLPRSRRAEQRSVDQRIEEATRDVGTRDAAIHERSAPPWLGSVARLNQTVGAMPLLEDDDAHLLPHFPEQLGPSSRPCAAPAGTCTWSSTSRPSTPPRPRSSPRWPTRSRAGCG